MLDHGKTLAFGAAIAVVFGVHSLRAQSEPLDLDPRWNAWLGCWTADTTRTGAAAVSAASATCIVPVEGTRAVEVLTIARGAIVARERLDASGRPHSINGNGCRGTETVNWSGSARRVYLHSAYTCSGAQAGSSTSLYAISSSGAWLRVEKVRSGSGAVTSFTQLRPTSLSSALSSNTIRAIESRQRLIATARAAVAVAITAQEIVDAVNNLDGDVVRAWLIASDQTWNFDVTQIALLTNAGVPSPILALVVSRGATQIDVAVAPTVYSVPIVEQPAVVTTAMNVCAPATCAPQYSAYNGYGYAPGYANPYGNPYASPYGGPLNPPPYPYPYSPFGFGAFSPFGSTTPIVINNTGNRDGNRDGKRDGRHNWSRPGSTHGHGGQPVTWSTGRGGPIGRPGSGGGGGGGGGRGGGGGAGRGR